MAFERENFLVARKLMLDKGEFTVECNISCGANVSKILSISTDSYVGECETLNGIINYSGAIDTKLVIMTDDGQINTICSTCPFSAKFENEKIQLGQDANIKVKVIDNNIESIGGELVKVAVVLEQSGFVIANCEVGTINCHDDDICFKTEEITIIK